MTNPYLNRNAISKPEEFFGRRELVERILDRWSSSTPQSVAIVGDRRIGKSSLLNYLQYAGCKRDPNLIVVLIDLSFQGAKNAEEFFDVLLTEIYDKAKLGEPPKNHNIVEFLNIVTEIEKAGNRLIVLFDEFDFLLVGKDKNQEFDISFFGSLRSIANRQQVAYLTASLKEPHRLVEDYSIQMSPFWNIFTTERLGPFSPAEASELIEKPSKAKGSSLKGSIELILQMAGYHPYFLQIACSLIFAHKTKGGEMDEENKEKLLEAFVTNFEVKEHINNLWGKLLNQNEQNVLKTIVQDKAILSEEHQRTVEILETKGYLVRDQNYVRPFSIALTEHIARITGTDSSMIYLLSTQANTTERPAIEKASPPVPPAESPGTREYRRTLLVAFLLLVGLIAVAIAAILLSHYQAVGALLAIASFAVALLITGLLIFDPDRVRPLIDFWIRQSRPPNDSQNDET